MKIKYLTFLVPALILSLMGQAQVVVNNTNTVASYVQNVLLGGGVTVSNITFNGTAANVQNEQVGEFTDVSLSIGLPNGMIVGSGDVNLAAQPNIGGGSSLGGTGNSGSDPDLVAIASAGIFDEAILEFDFIPNGDTLSFNYVFASEEYEEYVCSGFNDVFGFFLTGNNPSGGTYTAQNIALVPDPLVPGTFTSTAVAINAVNPGVAGSSGSAATCTALDPNWASYNVFYQTNPGTSYEYDGRTVTLPIIALVNCGETYHIKIAIADAGDASFDSGVFLEAGSFSSTGGLDAASASVPADIELCGAPYIVNFTNGVNNPPQNYWDFGDGVGTDTLPNPVYTYADTGSYVVMYVAIDSSLCIPTDTAYFNVTIIENDTLDAQFNIPAYDPCVDSLTIQLNFTGSGADSLYWNMGNGVTFFNDTAITYTYTTPGTFTVTLEAFDTLCNSSFTLTDTVFFNPVITLVNATAPADVFTCSAPYNMSFIGNSSAPPQNYWDFGDGVGTDTLLNPMYTYADTGSYQVMYVVIDSSTCNIADTAYFNVTLALNDSLDAQFNIPPYDACVDSLTIQLAFTGSGADSLYWDMGNVDSFIDSTSITYTYTTPGNYIITMEAYDLLCTNTFTLTDTVFFNPIITTVNAVVPPSILLCTSPYVVNLTGNNPPPPNSYWDFGDGIGFAIDDNNPAYTYPASGNYTVTYVAIDSSTCNIADTATFPVSLQIAPVFSATLNFDPPKPCESDTFLVELNFTGTGQDSLVWDLGDGNQIINVDSFSYLYADAGTYVVTMTAYNFLCNIVVPVSNEVTFTEFTGTESLIPNVFTPNGDGKNDVLEFQGIDADATYNVQIFNRWGTKVFEDSNALNHWDGGSHDSGTYFYIIRYTDICSDEEKVEKGTVTLLK